MAPLKRRLKRWTNEEERRGGGDGFAMKGKHLEDRAGGGEDSVDNAYKNQSSSDVQRVAREQIGGGTRICHHDKIAVVDEARQI
jgi:hypothetical protein